MVLLNGPSTDKKRTKREELQAYQDMSGDTEPLLVIPDIPIDLSHLVSFYNKIGEFSYQSIHAYQQVSGVKLARYEIEGLRAIDAARSGV